MHLFVCVFIQALSSFPPALLRKGGKINHPQQREWNHHAHIFACCNGEASSPVSNKSEWCLSYCYPGNDDSSYFFEVKHLSSWGDQFVNLPSCSLSSQSLLRIGGFLVVSCWSQWHLFFSKNRFLISSLTCFPARSPFCRAQADSVFRPFTTAAPGTSLKSRQQEVQLLLFLSTNTEVGNKILQTVRISVSTLTAHAQQVLSVSFHYYFFLTPFGFIWVLRSHALSGTWEHFPKKPSCIPEKKKKDDTDCWTMIAQIKPERLFEWRISHLQCESLTSASRQHWLLGTCFFSSCCWGPPAPCGINRGEDTKEYKTVSSNQVNRLDQRRPMSADVQYNSTGTFY